ncbi:MAG TPA: chemotaxis protein CheW [Gemmatimonadaceae bacterium]|nr:chemotaxis protein CheW [Gemmatimonadaceae bacterium]
MDTSRYAALFLSEARDSLAAARAALERLRSDHENAAALAAAFRAIHTIKGMAGMMGYGAVAALAHEVEALLAAIRDGRAALEPSGVALLEEGCDWLEGLCERAVADGLSSGAAEGAAHPGALDTLLRRLKDAQVGQGAAEKSEGGSSERSPAPLARERADDLWSSESERVRTSGRYIRIELRRLDALMDLTGELVVARGRLAHRLSRLADREVADAAAAVDRIVSELQDAVMASRLVPAWELLDRFPRVVREAARSLGKEVEFHIEGRDIELDRSLLDQMVDPLVHLLRNAVDHGIERPEQRLAHGKPAAGRIVLHAAREESSVVIRITDDGRGIDRRALRAKAEAAGFTVGDLGDDEILRIIARPGFSTADRVTQLSGRGVGMDVVVARVRALGGSVELRTREGEGTTVTLRLPPTLAIVSALMVRVGEESYAVPLTYVRESVAAGMGVHKLRGRRVLLLREEVVPLVDLRDVVGLAPRDVEGRQIVIVEVAGRRGGLVVDRLLGQEEIVIKSFDAVRGVAPHFSGATILPSGRPALILEVSSLF